MIRRLWYLMLGGLAVWAWHRIRGASRSPWMVRVVMDIPAALLPVGAVGFGGELQAIMPADFEPSPPNPDDGTDPATGLPRGLPPGEM